MKKKGKKRISIALTVAMIAGLTACGKGNGGNGNSGSSAADSSLAKQYVFKEQALDLNMDSDNMNIDLLTRKGDTVYLLFETYEYFENGNQSLLHLTTMKPDGTVIDTVELPMWKERLRRLRHLHRAVRLPGTEMKQCLLRSRRSAHRILRQRIWMW